MDIAAILLWISSCTTCIISLFKDIFRKRSLVPEDTCSSSEFIRLAAWHNYYHHQDIKASTESASQQLAKQHSEIKDYLDDFRQQYQLSTQRLERINRRLTTNQEAHHKNTQQISAILRRLQRQSARVQTTQEKIREIGESIQQIQSSLDTRQQDDNNNQQWGSWGPWDSTGWNENSWDNNNNTVNPADLQIQPPTSAEQRGFNNWTNSLEEAIFGGSDTTTEEPLLPTPPPSPQIYNKDDPEDEEGKYHLDYNILKDLLLRL